MPEMAFPADDGTMVTSGWLPIKCLAARPVNIIALPSVGDQVQLHSDSGDGENLVVSMASYGGSKIPPISPVTGQPPQSGEVWISTATGWLHMTGGSTFIGDNLFVTGNVTWGYGTEGQTDAEEHLHSYKPGTGATTNTGAPVAGT